EETSKDRDDILQRAMRLLAERALPFLHEGPGQMQLGDFLGEVAADPLARRVEAGPIVEPADELQQLRKRSAHRLTEPVRRPTTAPASERAGRAPGAWHRSALRGRRSVRR